MVCAKTETNLHQFQLNMKHKHPRNINAVQGGDTECLRTGDDDMCIDMLYVPGLSRHLGSPV